MTPRIARSARFDLAKVDADEDAITPATILCASDPAQPPPRPPKSTRRELLTGTTESIHQQAKSHSMPRTIPQHTLIRSSSIDTRRKRRCLTSFKRCLHRLSAVFYNRSSRHDIGNQLCCKPTASSPIIPRALPSDSQTQYAKVSDYTSNEYVRGRDYYHRANGGCFSCLTSLCHRGEGKKYCPAMQKTAATTEKTSETKTEVIAGDTASIMRRDNHQIPASICAPSGLHVPHIDEGSPHSTSTITYAEYEEAVLLAGRHERERDELSERHHLQVDALERKQREEVDALTRRHQAELEGISDHAQGIHTAARLAQDDRKPARSGLERRHVDLPKFIFKDDQSHAGNAGLRHPVSGTVDHQQSFITLQQGERRQRKNSEEQTEADKITHALREHSRYPVAATKGPKHPRLTASDPPTPEQHQRQQRNPRGQRTHPTNARLLSSPLLSLSSLSSSPSRNIDHPTLPRTSSKRSLRSTDRAYTKRSVQNSPLDEALKTARNTTQAAILRRQYLERYTPYKMRPLDGAEYTARFGPPSVVSDASSGAQIDGMTPSEPQPILMGNVMGLSPSAFSTPAHPTFGRADSERARRRVRPADLHGDAAFETSIDRVHMREALEGIVDGMFQRIGLQAQMDMIEWLDYESRGRARSGGESGWVFPTEELGRRWERFGANWALVEWNGRLGSEGGVKNNVDDLIVVRWDRMPLSVLRTVWTYLWEWEDFWDREEIARGRHFFPSLSFFSAV